MKKVVEGLDYSFQTPSLLTQALTHPSVLHSVEGCGFERLEFLGDRVLGLVIAEWLFTLFPHEEEGDLAKRLASLVCKETLVEVALALGLADSMRIRQEKSHSQQKRRATLLADGCEALIGALYLDGGLPTAQAFIQRYWQPYLHTTQPPPADPKSSLQEWIQAQGKTRPIYQVVTSLGPAHAPRFVVEVQIEGYPPVQGEGSSKQLAEKAAAQHFLEILNISSR